MKKRNYCTNCYIKIKGLPSWVGTKMYCARCYYFEKESTKKKNNRKESLFWSKFRENVSENIKVKGGNKRK